MKAIAAASAVVLMAIAAPAQASTPKATFRVSLEGTQTNTWSEEGFEPISQGEQDCGIARKRSGSERITFSTSAPLTARMERRKFHRKPIPRIRFASGDESFKVPAHVVRSAENHDTDTCTGQEIPPADPYDCGTRTLDWRVFIAPVYLHRDHIWVGDDYRDQDQNDPFQSCPYSGTEFPKMLEFRDIPGPEGRLELIDSPLSTSKLFKRGVKHLEVRGHGSERDSDLEPGVHSLTTLDWHVTLDRVK
jgi:hypothetical protein